MSNLLKNIEKIGYAFFHSVDGLRYLMKERAFRQELFIGVILFVIELFRSTPRALQLYLLSSYCIILILEAVNSAIEATIDRIGTDIHPLSKKSKDIGSAFVFIAMVHFGIIWLISFFL